MGKKLFLSVAITASVVCIYINTSYIPVSSLGLRNIEALARVESTVCPDHNYVPDVCIHAKEIRTNVECSTNGEISTVGKNLKVLIRGGRLMKFCMRKKIVTSWHRVHVVTKGK